MRGPLTSLALGGLLCCVASAGFAQSNQAKFFVGKWYVADPKVCKGLMKLAKARATIRLFKNTQG